jgi:hypothetical protein
LSKNPIIDFRPLCKLKKLTELRLDESQMKSVEIQALREALPNCKIS